MSIILFSFSISKESSRPELLSAIIVLDFLYIFIVGILILLKVSKVLSTKELEEEGLTLHLRLPQFFNLALSPAIIVAVFATISLNFGNGGLVFRKVQRVVGNSLSCSTYKMEHTQSLKNDAFWLVKSIKC